MLILNACATVGVTIVKQAPAKAENCQLELFSGEAEVKKPFEVLCIVDTRSGSHAFADKTVSGAVNEARPAACKCGADGIIVADARSEGMSLTGYGQGFALLKAIKFTEEKKTEPAGVEEIDAK